jgi:hypothetical protein
VEFDGNGFSFRRFRSEPTWFPKLVSHIAIRNIFIPQQPSSSAIWYIRQWRDIMANIMSMRQKTISFNQIMIKSIILLGHEQKTAVMQQCKRGTLPIITIFRGYIIWSSKTFSHHHIWSKEHKLKEKPFGDYSFDSLHLSIYIVCSLHITCMVQLNFS